jgi:uncharacterized protein YjlB
MEEIESVGAPLTSCLNPPSVVSVVLEESEHIPNSRLPLLFYEQAFKLPAHEQAALIERVFARHAWGDSWRNGIYSYHHYHSTAHEVLAVFSGSGTVQFGGERGVQRELQMGDVVIIPAGVAHKNLLSGDDFAVVGAYPAGQKWDMCYGRAEERPEADENIRGVRLPHQDPLYGTDGPLLKHWTRIS